MGPDRKGQKRMNFDMHSTLEQLWSVAASWKIQLALVAARAFLSTEEAAR